jgi:uncharacterized cupredoxin-like copper-binding protein/mono/diheme cytochrome c family protein
MADDRSGRELAPRGSGEIEAPGSELTPVDGERRDVERFSAGPRAHSVGLTEERSAQIVRQSANARNIVFLAILLIALFIPIYWFYESGIPALGTEGRMDAEADVQYVTDVARGYELYLANCAECHGDNGQGGVGPPLNDQGKLYNVLTPAGQPGNGHLNPDYLDNVLTVGGRYVCGNPDSLMQAWKRPAGPLNYRQVEELIAWITASQDVVFKRKVETHGEAAGAGAAEPEMVSGWRDPNYQPGPDDTPVPDCWTKPAGTEGTTGGAATSNGAAAAATAPPVAGGTPEQPRVIQLNATAALQFTDPDGNVVPEIVVLPGETIEFQIDNTANFDHNFWIGPASEVSVPNNETDVGHPTWQSGVQTVTWTVPASGDIPPDLQFACTVPGHYAAGMHGNIVIASGDAGGTSGDAAAASEPPAEGADAAAGDGGDAAAAEPAAEAGGPRVINLTATAALQFLAEDGSPLQLLDVSPGETIEFVIDNEAGFDHNFWIGPASEISQPNVETSEGIPTWQSGEQTLTWTVPEEIPPDLQFGCTIPGHYAAGMHGDIVISS